MSREKQRVTALIVVALLSVTAWVSVGLHLAGALAMPAVG